MIALPPYPRKQRPPTTYAGPSLTLSKGGAPRRGNSLVWGKFFTIN